LHPYVANDLLWKLTQAIGWQVFLIEQVRNLTE